MLGQNDEALVECRRLDANLALFNDKYEQKNVYKEDAFGRYLSGIVYESAGNLEDAYIDYYKAFKAFKDYGEDYGTPMPDTLVSDLRRTAAAAGRLEEVTGLGLKMEDSITEKKGGDAPAVVLIHLNGKAPFKVEDVIFLPTEHGPVSLAFPRFVVTPPRCRESRLVVEPADIGRFRKAPGALSGTPALAEDINAIAVKNLEDRKGRVIAKTIARAVAKQVAIGKATKKNNGARFLLNVANLFIERADTRSWRTLPGEIYISRTFLPEGVYDASVRSCGEVRSLGKIALKAGETKFLLYETMY
jgi:hypothetical protein